MAATTKGPSLFPSEAVLELPLPATVPQPAPSLPHHVSPSAGSEAFTFPKPESWLADAVGTAVLFEDDEVRGKCSRSLRTFFRSFRDAALHAQCGRIASPQTPRARSTRTTTTTGC